MRAGSRLFGFKPKTREQVENHKGSGKQHGAEVALAGYSPGTITGHSVERRAGKFFHSSAQGERDQSSKIPSGQPGLNESRRG